MNTTRKVNPNALLWSEPASMSIINMYRSMPELWCTTHALYYNKVAKSNSWSYIARVLECNVEIVKAKMDSLIARYRREKRKVNKWMAKGTVYISDWFAYEALQFLDDNLRFRRGRITMGNNKYLKKLIETTAPKPESTLIAQTVVSEGPKPPNAPTETKVICELCAKRSHSTDYFDKIYRKYDSYNEKDKADIINGFNIVLLNAEFRKYNINGFNDLSVVHQTWFLAETKRIFGNVMPTQN